MTKKKEVKIYVEIRDDDKPQRNVRDSRYVIELKVNGTFEQASDLVRKFQDVVRNFNRRGTGEPMRFKE